MVLAPPSPTTARVREASNTGMTWAHQPIEQKTPFPAIPTLLGHHIVA